MTDQETSLHEPAMAVCALIMVSQMIFHFIRFGDDPEHDSSLWLGCAALVGFVILVVQAA